MRIGELSTRTGVSRRSLRYYEDQGLLVSSRSPSGQRHYDDEHVERVRLIQAFLAAGMSTSTIAAMVPCMAKPSRGGAHRALEIMGRERARLSSAIDDLAAARSALDHLIEVNREYLAQSTGAEP
ncbi:MerR family transcriptional regulator [Allostreptomyces psammosilenae]|uniref:DNA-binding transcriptional MerR regulator n=1 Tax=Allostreptomyces psammosilenae TaxID=1892865 RepID=A0A852ZQC6_9ACTN|nr:MerR family transcriptional regulator [Allostreptomyces psammosilenae]NYI04579.1 DNA-binding transcriptional MerR regulator [Allostreptomyces psammosilenae]